MPRCRRSGGLLDRNGLPHFKGHLRGNETDQVAALAQTTVVIGQLNNQEVALKVSKNKKRINVVPIETLSNEEREAEGVKQTPAIPAHTTAELTNTIQSAAP